MLFKLPVPSGFGNARRFLRGILGAPGGTRLFLCFWGRVMWCVLARSVHARRVFGERQGDIASPYTDHYFHACVISSLSIFSVSQLLKADTVEVTAIVQGKTMLHTVPGTVHHLWTVHLYPPAITTHTHTQSTNIVSK